MVVDTSAILAVFFAEEHGTWAAEQLAANRGELCMSTVNLTEALIILKDRQPNLAEELQDQLFATGIEFVPPNIQQAEIAAGARLRRSQPAIAAGMRLRYRVPRDNTRIRSRVRFVQGTGTTAEPSQVRLPRHESPVRGRRSSKALG